MKRRLLFGCAGKTASAWTHVSLAACASGFVANDGRDMWRLESNGQLLNVGAGKCVAIGKSGQVVLESCDAARGRNGGLSKWEMQGNGQWKLASPDGRCLSQDGPAPGDANLAMRVAAVATSTATRAHGAAAPCGVACDVHAHIWLLPGAPMAVDASAATFWVSKYNDVGGPVSFIADLGEDVHTHELEIDLGVPAQVVCSASIDVR